MDAGLVHAEREKRQESSSPPVPIKTYQWEDVRRARQQGGYPWTHLDKAPLEERDITAESILEETDPRMSREHSRDRRTPVGDGPQKILKLDSSPGSSRKLEGEDESVHIPIFSKEVSLDSEDDLLSKPVQQRILTDNIKVTKDAIVVPVSPKSILKRKHPEKITAIGDDSPRNSKCCHPLVEKIKHIADKTIHKPQQKRTPNRTKFDEKQEIITLDNSPGTERRERRIAAELEKETDNERVTISLVMKGDDGTKHEYEDMDTRSADSKDPSLMFDEPMEDEETAVRNVKTMYDTSMTAPRIDAEDSPADADEPADPEGKGSPNLVITEMPDDAEEEESAADDADKKAVHFEPAASALSDKSSEDGGDDFWSKIGDHEYEPIGKPVSEIELTPREVVEPTPPPEASPTPPPPAVYVSDDEPPLEDDASSTTSRERQFLRPPTDDEPPPEDSHETPDEREGTSSSAALQKQIEDRFFVDTPTTAESRTDCEISTSQVDSSALEDLPLKRENRKRSMMSTEASKLQQRIKSQTGKLRTKLKTIKKPNFTMPERPKFNMPERPKFTMPERPKFTMPERPKFTMPERPKFNLPERPKINFPDRSKFRLPERPKFNMPERPKMNFFDKTKFNLPDRPKFTMPDKSKFKLPDRPKINFSAFSRNKENGRRDSDKGEKSTESSSAPKKRMLDFDFKTYPRFSKFKKEKKGSKAERPGTPPPGFATVPRVTKDRQAVMNAAHWEDSSNRSADTEPRHYGVPQGYPSETDKDFQSKLAQVDKDYNQMQEEYEREKISKAKLENAEIWNAMEKSSVQRMEHRVSLPYYLPGSEQNVSDGDQAMEKADDESSAASTGHHRRGVLEEIDNDEFFLRQKGISQDNIEVGKYLSNEIRDAFRSPINALSQMDNNPAENRKNVVYLETATVENSNPPVVFLEKSDNQFKNVYLDSVEPDEYMEEEDEEGRNQNMIEHDDGYYTFPPVRPSRSRKMKSHNSLEKSIDDIQIEKMESVENIPAPVMFQEPKSEPEKNGVLRKSIFSSNFKEPEMDNLNEYENEMEQVREIPSVPKRRKKNKDFNYSEDGSLFNGSYEADTWMKIKNMEEDELVNDDEVIVHRMEYVMPNAESDLPEESPVPPRRNRSRSRGSRATSACDDDRTSRGADSLTLDSHANLPSADLDFLDDLDDGPGYAVVDKVPPKKMEPPPRPPAPVRRNRSIKSLSGERQFFTVPRALKEASPPRRPSRNYSTLGPSRPPRKKSTTSLSDIKNIQDDSYTEPTEYVEIDDDDDLHKDLKSGEVVDKMKHRPLPPPPRPPRGPKKKKDSDDRKDDDAEFEGSLEQFSGSMPAHDSEIDIPHTMDDVEFITDREELIEFRIQDEEYDDQNDEIIEIEVSTQTDPLPDDFDYTIGMEESFTDSQKDEHTAQANSYVEDHEENSIDAEILYKGLQRFRESSRPDSRTGRPKTPIDRPKTPIDRPKTPLGRMSPAILVERRVSSPTRIGDHNEFVTEASLTVIPFEEPEPEISHSISEPSRHSQIWEAFNANDEVEAFIKREEILLNNEPVNIMESIPASVVEHIAEPVIVAVQQQPIPVDTTPVAIEAEPEEVKIPHTVEEISIPRAVEEVITPQAVEEDVIQRVVAQVEEVKPSPPPVQDNQIVVQPLSSEMDVLTTQKLQVSDLEVQRLTVSELQAHKILVSEIEGLSLRVTDINSSSGNIIVSGIELSPGIFEEILHKFSQMGTASAPVSTQTPAEVLQPRCESSQETQTDTMPEVKIDADHPILAAVVQEAFQGNQQNLEDVAGPSHAPERPPLPQYPPAGYPMGYFPEYSLPPAAYYRLRHPMERPDISDGEMPQPSRRRKHKREPVSSSEDESYRPLPRRAATRTPEPSVTELSGQLFRACQTSLGRTMRQILSYISSHFGGGENKKDMQMALVIVLVMIAGLILLGVGDGRTVHHHHWDFMNPPNNK